MIKGSSQLEWTTDHAVLNHGSTKRHMNSGRLQTAWRDVKRKCLML